MKCRFWSQYESLVYEMEGNLTDNDRSNVQQPNTLSHFRGSTELATG